MKEAETDSLVSCPIVCGEYMRATGFFYSTGEKTYLITARHNCLPTHGTKLKTGDGITDFQTEDFLTRIDIYLRTSSGFDVKRVDITEQDGVIQTSEIDVLCVPIDSEPNEYGYYVWEESDITSPQDAGASLNSIGFNKFPDSSDGYDIETYCSRLGKPALLSLENEIGEEVNKSQFGLMPPAIDEGFVGSDDDYNGFSGAPIIGNGLVGIHSHIQHPSADVLEQNDFDEFILISYTRADLLPKILS